MAEAASGSAMNDAQARLEIVRVGRSLFERGYVHGTSGNISVRLDDGFLITPTDACLGFLEPSRLADVDAEGAQRSGDPASKTLALHRAIYAADPQARCVIHTHSTHLVALTLIGVWRNESILPPVTPYFVMKVGHVPLIPYHRPGAPELGRLIAAAIEDNRAHGRQLRAVMLDRPERLARIAGRSDGHARGARGNRQAVAARRRPGPQPHRDPARRAAASLRHTLVTSASAKALGA